MESTTKIYKSPLWLRYAIPVFAVLIAIAARVEMIGWFEGRYPLILFIIPTLVATWYGGAVPGIFAGVLGVIAGANLLKPYNLQIDTGLGLERLAIFSLVCSFCIFFITRLHKERHRAEANEKRLKKEIHDRGEIEKEMREEMRIRLNAETALAQALARAEKANTAKTEFLANMSHEIRTPMNAVVGLANILMLSNPLTPKQKEFIATLKLSADSLLALINDMLDIAKIEASSIELENIPFNLRHLAEDVVSIMGLKAREKNIDLLVDAEALGPGTFNGDPTRIRQIIMNLCSNAIKFTHRGTVSIVLNTAPQNADISKVSISVKDTGIGIPADQIGNIFEKFIQGDSAINRQYGGSGLGLTITKDLVRIMGGTISVTSEPGAGSVFTVTLSLRRSDAPTHILSRTQNAGASANGYAQKKILLVEDHPANVLVASTFLEYFGFDYDIARNGAEALQRLETGQYMVVLMDVQMPGIDGLETTRRIRSIERRDGGRRLPIIGMTAHAMPSDREQCLEAGMDDYITKPFNPDDLQRKLRNFTLYDADSTRAAMVEREVAE